MSARAILRVSCPDAKGLVARLATFIHANNGNIVDSDHHTDLAFDRFLARFEWELDGFGIPRDALPSAVGTLCAGLDAEWLLSFSDLRPRLALMVTRQSHCLEDLLWRHRAGELACEIPLIVSNHDRLRPLADREGIRYEHIVVEKGKKEAAEALLLELLAEERIDVVVMAKYMQILSLDFLAQAPRIINIHHSFLPAFRGARPYHQAHSRGVKLIGATAHYATADLDEGPIIAQDVGRVSHRDSIKDLIRLGRDLERTVLARAVRLDLLGRVLVYGNRTVVFS